MVISLENVTKIFGKTRVVDDVSVKFSSGNISVVVGDHGAGDAPLQHGNPVRVSSVGTFFNAFAEQTLEPAPVILLKQRLGCLDQFPVYTVIHTEGQR